MDPNNFLTEFNEGGSHEENPLGGIPQGMGSNGKMNTVEEGETRHGDYVFSDRLKVTDDMIKKYNLPKNLKNKTFADASKSISKLTEGNPNSTIERETAKEMIERLTLASEEARVMEELKSNPQMVQQLAQQMRGGGQGMPQGVQPEGIGMEGIPQQGIPPQEMNPQMMGLEEGMLEEMGVPMQQQFNSGGLMGGDYVWGQSNGITSPASTGFGANVGNMNPAAVVQGAYTIGNNMFGDTGVTDMGTQKHANVNMGAEIGSGAMSGASMGASMGTAIMPGLGTAIGAGVGTVVGGISGLIGGKRKSKAVARQNSIADRHRMVSYGNINELRNSGYLNNDPYNPYDPYDIMSSFRPLDYASSRGIIDDEDLRLRMMRATSPTPQITSELTPVEPERLNPEYFDTPLKSKLAQSIGDDGDGDDDKTFWSNLWDGTTQAMRYAPAITDAYQLATLRKPEQENLDRLNTRYKRNYVDERQLQNTISNGYNNAVNSLTNASGGSESALRANLQGANLSRLRAMSDAYINAENINRNEDSIAQQFDLSVDSTNLQQSNTEKEINAMNRAAYDTNRSMLISQLGKNLGNIGLEEMRKKYPEWLDLYYDYRGRFRNTDRD